MAELRRGQSGRIAMAAAFLALLGTRVQRFQAIGVKDVDALLRRQGSRRRGHAVVLAVACEPPSRLPRSTR